MASPAFYDPRLTDVAAVRAILDAPARSGKVLELPVMGAADLFALGALSHPLIDSHALQWWDAQPDQEAAARRGYDHMVRRGMIDPATGRIHPELGVILAARIRPAFIMALRPRPADEMLPGRFLGIADETAGLRAVLGEDAPPERTRHYEELGPIYLYELATAPKASQTVASLAAGHRHLVIDFYLPGSKTSLPSRRFTVAHALRRLRVEQVTPATAPQRVTCSEAELAGLLLDTMTEACQ